MSNQLNGTTAYHPQLPVGVVEFNHQIAGHKFSLEDSNFTSILSVNNSDIILKQIQQGRKGPCEKNFYQKVWLQDLSTLSSEAYELRYFIPQYFGSQKYEINGREQHFLKLENVVARFSKPCIIDIKIGAITSDPLASPAIIERHRMTKPHAATTQLTILGYKTFDPQTNSVMSIDKCETKTLNLDGVKDGCLHTTLVPALRSFFSPATQIGPLGVQNGHSNYRAIILISIINRLERMLTWFDSQCEIHMFSSSILIAYEMDSDVIEIQLDYDNYDIDSLFETKMLDFTHVFDGNGKPDENYKGGLNNLVLFLKELL